MPVRYFNLIIPITVYLLQVQVSFSQTVFLQSAKIEFEKKENIYKRLGTNEFADMIKKGKPEFQTTYFDLLFKGNESFYVNGKEVPQDPWAELWGGELNVQKHIYTNFSTYSIREKKDIFEGSFLLNDSIIPVEWKLVNEHREIAGFDCLKAIGRFYDTLYVVAFYCPQMISSCGPQGFGGLPGMILGLAFPRFYTTWFATKVEAMPVTAEMLQPPIKGKPKQISRADIFDMVNRAMRNWNMDNEEEKQRAIWQIVL